MGRNRSLQSPHEVGPDDAVYGFIENTEHGYDVLVLVLGDELGEGPDEIECPLSVRETHDAHHLLQTFVSITVNEMQRREERVGTYKVDRALFAGMIKPVLRSGDGMKVEVDPEAILPRPCDGPDHTKKETAVSPGLGKREREGESNA